MFLSRLIARLRGKRCLPALLDHYEPVARGVLVVETALREYLNSGACLAFNTLVAEIDTLEGRADKIKRHIRNHLPRAAFLEVDKILLLGYTRSQDNILDSAQDALAWLGARTAALPAPLLESLRDYGRDVSETVRLLGPAIQATCDLVYGQSADRPGTKKTFHAVRVSHAKVSKAKRRLVKTALETPADFRDVYQFMKFVEHLHAMSHNAEGCADTLRAMIAR